MAWREGIGTAGLVSLCVWTALVGVGIAYQLAALWLVRRHFGTKAPATLIPAPAVTLLKPLYGAEPHLADNLASFLAQDYAAPVQMVCGLNRPADPARGAVDALRARHPQADIALAPGPCPPASNGKIANLANMMALAAHDVLILSDSDMAVAPDYLARVTTALAQPGVGAVSCLYVGRGDTGVWSQLGAAIISFQTTPSMVLGLAAGLARPCMGSTIALRRSTLEAIGSFDRFADVLADDHAIGEAVAGLGLAVAIPAMLVEHAGTEASFTELWRHFLRWASTIRALNPGGHVGSVVTHPLPLALLMVPFAPAPGMALATLALIARLALARTMRQVANRQCAPLWCVPVGDLIGFAVFLASLVARKIDWRGVRLTMKPEGRISPMQN